MARRAVLDMTLLIAEGGEHEPPEPPAGVRELAVSVVKLAELEMGVATDS